MFLILQWHNNNLTYFITTKSDKPDICTNVTVLNITYFLVCFRGFWEGM